MTKKILLLILLLPLLLMVCLFTTTNTVSLAINVPVSGIEINGEKIIYLDLDKNESYDVDYTIYPTNAANKKVEFSMEKVGDSRLPELLFENDKIVAKSVGIAKVYLTTVDGGYKDSFIVQVDSKSLQGIESSCNVEKMYVGEKAIISTEFIPSNTSNQLLKYTSNNELVATVDERGYITGVGRGIATILIESVDNSEIKDTVVIEILNRDILDISQSSINTWSQTGTINVSIDEIEEEYELSVNLYDNNKNPLGTNILLYEIDKTNIERGQILINYTFVDKDFIGKIFVEIKIKTELNLEVKKECEINKVNDIDVSFDYNQVPNFTVGQTSYLFVNLNPSDANVTYEITVNNDNIMATTSGKQILINALKPGVSTVSLKVINNDNKEQFKETQIDVIVLPSAFIISELATSYGIENIWTIGKKDANGNDSEFKLNLSFGNTELGKDFLENIKWVSNKIEVLIDNNGNIKFNDDDFNGLVEFKAVFEYDNFSFESSSFVVRCIANGVNVFSYADLLKTVNNKSIVVLHKNIEEDFGYDENGNIVYTEINTNYDWTHYKNLGRLEAPKVKVLLQIKNDIYGNGYMINAHNIAYGLDNNGQLSNDALFKGPLNFVSMSEGEGGLISVKAQDNIAFAVYENVKLSNLELKSCNLLADSNGQYDLTDLNYVGTTVEVFGDNVTIEYSRISNGRNTLRIFGDYDDPNKVINTYINNSVLSSARDFIIRMGSNAFEFNPEVASPRLPNDTGIKFPVYQNYYQMTKEQKQEYDEKFIKTFVNVKNSAFKDSGIFAIGIDAHFAGEALKNGEQFIKGLLSSWYDLAKTSYGAKLTLEEDVRIYDWKELDKIDSSSLIEIIGESQYADQLKFDISEMLHSISENPNFKNIVTKHNNKDYVHSGIAIFGGGKNYGVCEFKNYEFYLLNGYSVSLADVNKAFLNAAAGNEKFYFLLHDSTNVNFLPSKQEEILNSSDAYSFIYPNK